MADNLAHFEKTTGKSTGIDAMPAPAGLVGLARTIPGNVDRLAHYLKRCSPRLLLTMGTEAAAFTRGLEFDAMAAKVEHLFYADPVRLDVLGIEVAVVHLVHPHLFIKKNAKWTGRHRAWCGRQGRGLVAEAR